MAFTVTYADGTVTNYDDKSHWTIEGGVLKIGAAKDKWTFLVSPSHWSTIETDPPKPRKQTVTRIR
ncbi:hypothetical protein OS121_13135 [Mycolicibacterium mucogenicum]|uniref:hypothetical protein n=1 Tax=Mycolicibacterium mucogenicum TaxID=56689 RepID=UPI002269C408|nr:hypothetical protein [Mycolicibacterium mucogenicum]MCX8556028.1 hypothetical protein [Mycolicibacterium mucogenicum]